MKKKISEIINKFCKENNLIINVEYDNMPTGYEDANGTYDVVKNTVYINTSYI